MCKKSISWLNYLRGIGMGGQQVMPVIFPEIKKVIDSHGITMVCLDEAGAVRNIYDEQIFRLRDNERILKDLLTQTQQAAWQELLAMLSVHELINGSKNSQAQTLYQGIFAQLAPQFLPYHHALMAAVRHNGRLVGIMFIHRSSDQRKFHQKDQDILGKMLPTASKLFATDSAAMIGPSVLGVPGLMSVTGAGQILSICPKARQLLFMVNRPEIHLGTLAKEEQGESFDATFLRHLNDLSQRADATDHEKQVQWRHKNIWGEFMFRAYCMQDNNSATGDLTYLVTLQLLHPLAMSLVDKRKKLALTPKQLEICIPLVAGFTYDSIGEQQHISKHTVVSHVRTIFSKLEVRNRTELVTALISA